MKKTLKKTNAIVLIIASLSLTLVGCGTGADSSSMDAPLTPISILK